MKISESTGLNLNRRDFFKKAGLAVLGLGIAENIAKADKAGGGVPDRPLSRADRLRKERDDREEDMRRWRSFSEDDIRKMRNAYADDIARAETQSTVSPEKVIVGVGTAVAIAAAVWYSCIET